MNTFNPSLLPDLPASSSFLREVINTINEGVFLVDPSGRIVMVNPALEKVTGYSEAELLGQPCAMLHCDICERSRQEDDSHWCRLFSTRGENRRQGTIRRKDGTVVPVLKNAKALMDGDRVVMAVETLTDLTDIAARDRRIQELSRILGADQGFAGMIGTSPVMRRIYGIIEKAAKSEAPVIICGQSGTGKELAARAIHDLGGRSSGPFVQLNCAALNESLLESELFGHVKGAFTGATKDRQGRFEAADGGDIFLDEIGDVPLPTQVKLLRVLESKRIERVGDNRSIDVDVRIISATNRDLHELVRHRTFREDLLFRINTIPIHLPPLVERREDIPLLINHFINTNREQTGKDINGVSPEAMRRIMDYSWPGNIRELKSALEYAFVIASHGQIEDEHLPFYLAGVENACTCPTDMQSSSGDNAGIIADNITSESKRPDINGYENKKEFPDEKRDLLEALHRTGGNISQAAKELGVHRGTVHNRMRKWNVDIRRDIGEYR